MLALEPGAGGSLTPLKPIPRRFAERFPSLERGRVDVAEFPFLSHFAAEAAAAGQDGAAAVRSLPWTETDAQGQPCHLQARALRTGGRRLLLVEFADEMHERLRAIVQSAREETLVVEQQQKAQHAAILAANDSLEREVEARREAHARLLRYQEELRSLGDQLARVEETERRRIATALHDRVGQTLAVAMMQLGLLGQSVTSDSTKDLVARLRGLLEETIAATRSLTFELAPPILYELGLEAALDSLTRRAASDYGFAGRFEDDDAPKPVDDNVRSVLFQAVRELLHNVAKHAKASAVTVAARAAGRSIVVEVTDDGVGFAEPTGLDQRQDSRGFGLFNVRERLESLGGQLEIQASPGHGTRVFLRAPLSVDSGEARGAPAAVPRSDRPASSP